MAYAHTQSEGHSSAHSARSIGIIGSGPTGNYSLFYLVTRGCRASITVFEKSRELGKGFPYSSQTTTRSMLANIASIEIPPLHETFFEWLSSQDDRSLEAYRLQRATLSDRTIAPRRAIGDFFADQLRKTLALATSKGIHVRVLSNANVKDIVPVGKQLLVQWNASSSLFDHVIVASGHPPIVEGHDPHFFQSPYGRFLEMPPAQGNIGILGSSLSAWDAALCVAERLGEFRELENNELVYRAFQPGFHITMMSRTGMLPNIDFYFDFPFSEATHMTDEAVALACRDARPLDCVFDLFRLELSAKAPNHSQAIGLAHLNADSFPDAYFRHRKEMNPLDWLEAGLAVAEYQSTAHVECPWKSTILSMHERFEKVVPFLSSEDRQRFDRGMRRVFTDNYTAVPIESVRKLLALRRSNRLELRMLEGEYAILRGRGGMSVRSETASMNFDTLVDARGQSALRRGQVPFPTLRRELCKAGVEVEDLSPHYSFPLRGPLGERLSFLALPFLLHMRPFGLGLTTCASLGAETAAKLLLREGESLGDPLASAP